MNIFITGGTGGIGTSLTNRLLGMDCQVVVLTRTTLASTHRGLTYLHGDILQPESYRHAIREADAICHLAALTHSNDSNAYHRINVEGTKRLLDEAKAQGFTGRFLHVSTRAIGIECGAYGDSKAQAEELVLRSGLRWTILRPAEVFGASGNEAITALAASAKKSSVILLPGCGNLLLAPVHVDDVINAFTCTLTTGNGIGQIYTLAGPQEFTYREIAEKIAFHNGRKALFVPVPLALLRLAALVFRLLGFKRPPLVCDQIPRLRCPKCADIRSSQKDLKFNPRSLQQNLDAELL